MKFITSPQSFQNKGYYSPGIPSDGKLYFSGLMLHDPDTGETANGGIEVHTPLAHTNVECFLKAANLSLTSLVQSIFYIIDIAHREAINRVFPEFFGLRKPAHAVVPVPTLHHGCLVENEAFAEVNQG